jgi:hypothetical protein
VCVCVCVCVCVYLCMTLWVRVYAFDYWCVLWYIGGCLYYLFYLHRFFFVCVVISLLQVAKCRNEEEHRHDYFSPGIIFQVIYLNILAKSISPSLHEERP